MANFCGSDFDLYTEEGGEQVRVLSGRSLSTVVTASTTDTTSKSQSGQWMELAPCNIHSIDASWSGFKTESSGLIIQRMFSGSINKYIVKSNGMAAMVFNAKLSTYSGEGEYNGAEMVSFDIMSTGEVTPFNTLYDELIFLGVRVSVYSTLLSVSDYTGPCMLVLRVSDLMGQDFGFVNGVLDVASIEAFLGGGEGEVFIWYDQGPESNDLLNESGNPLPRISDLSGNVLFSGVMPAIENELTGDQPGLQTDNISPEVFDNVMFFVGDPNGTGAGSRDICAMFHTSENGGSAMDYLNNNFARLSSNGPDPITSTVALVDLLNYPFSLSGEVYTDVRRIRAEDGTTASTLSTESMANTNAFTILNGPEDNRRYRGRVSEYAMILEDPRLIVPDWQNTLDTWSTVRGKTFRGE